MLLGYTKGAKEHQQLNHLERVPVDEIFSESFDTVDFLEDSASAFQELLDYAEAKDTVVVSSLATLSRNYEELLTVIQVLEAEQLELLVLGLPEHTLAEWKQWFRWSLKNERLLHPQLIKVGAEKERNRKGYSIFSRKPEAKQLYREIIQCLWQKEKLTVIAKREGVPIATVYRIKQELEKIKLALILVACFVLAMISFKVTASFSDSLWVQLGIGLVATAFILYNTLVDSEEEY